MKLQSFVVATVAVAAGATWVLAAERATFILTNGEKVSGTVVFHTSERTNLRADTRQFSLGTNDGKEVAIEFDHIAVIDFVSGTPPTSELEALRPNSHMLALRDGSTQRGLLIDLIGGDTVRWQRANGGREDIPIRNVRRIYMNTESARSIFNYQPPASPGAGSGEAPTPPIPSGPGIVVLANQPWTDSGLVVQPGELIKFSPTGTILFGRLIGQSAPAVGNPGNPLSKSTTYPMPTAVVGSLIGRVGNGAPFFIGFGEEPLRMPARGRLQLGINDDSFGDNSGGFRVQMTRVRR